jgi:hypothetical protein
MQCSHTQQDGIAQVADTLADLLADNGACVHRPYLGMAYGAQLMAVLPRSTTMASVRRSTICANTQGCSIAQ